MLPNNADTTELIDNLLEEAGLVLQPELPASARIRLTDIIDEDGATGFVARFRDPKAVVESVLALAELVQLECDILLGNLLRSCSGSQIRRRVLESGADVEVEAPSDVLRGRSLDR